MICPNNETPWLCECDECNEVLFFIDSDPPDPEPCEACGRLFGHLDDCVVLGGTRDLRKARKQRVKERVAALKAELAKYEDEGERLLF